MLSYLLIPGRLRTPFLQVHIAKDLRPERSHSIAPKGPGTRPEAGLSLACSFPAACSSRFLGCRDQLEHPEDHTTGGTQDKAALFSMQRTSWPSVAADGVRLQELRALLQKVERCLDSGLGACYMRDFRIAKIVADAIRHFHGKRYQVLAWCVMPNHVHVVFSTLGERKLEAILHSWKSFSAQGANRLLGRSGSFWQREYFDHLVRNEASLSRIIRYVQENPQKAGLRDWPWVGTEELRSGGFQPAADSEKAGKMPALQKTLASSRL